jgi:hypothetical protein
MKSAPVVLKVYINREEKRRIAANAGACGLSLSAYVRTLTLGERPAAAIDLDAMDKLLKLSADLGRLGGLLKMLLTNDERLDDMGRDMGRATIDGTLVDIRAAQAEFLSMVKAFAGEARLRMRKNAGM